MVEKQTGLETEKSNAADKDDIAQSQACYTRHRRMPEVNSLCTDSRPLRTNTVLCHSTQYSLLFSNGAKLKRIFQAVIQLTLVSLSLP